MADSDRGARKERLRALRPVAMDDTPYGQRVIRERETRLARYGVVTQMIDIGTRSDAEPCRPAA